MSDRKILDIADQYLGVGDIAQMRDSKTLWKGTEDQIRRLSPETRDATLDATVFDVIKYLQTGRGMPVGMASFYEPDIKANESSGLTFGDFVGPDGFDNRPLLGYYERSVGPDPAGPHGPSVRNKLVRFDLGQPNEVDIEADTMLQLYAGEALELSRRADAGTASPEELRLLEAYRNFFQSRTGY